jgi:hypothetical protein
MTKTITRLFDDYSDATAAVRDLEALGIPHDDISIVANNAHGKHGSDADHDHDSVNDHGDVSRGVSTGALLGGAGGLLAGLGLLAIPGLGPIVAIGAAGGAATGSIVGTLKNAGHSEEDSHVYAEGVRRGGTMVSARVPDTNSAQAEAVLDRNKPVDVATRGAAYRQTGWTGFDENAPAFTSDEIDRDRSTYGTSATRL